MTDRSVDDFLQHELSQASPDSSGVFTLSPEEALRKLAEFQLPGPQSWASKIVQAAVVAGACKISVRLMEKEAIFTIRGPLDWSLEEVEKAFFEPGPGSDRALWQLKQGLWSVGLASGRPFRLQGQGWIQALVWNGQQFSRQQCEAADLTVISVRHSAVAESRGLSYYLASGVSTHNAEILLELSTRGFACPVALDVDAMRIDALQGCPGQGNSSSSILLQVGFVNLNLPALQIPAHTLKASSFPGELPTEAGMFLLLAAHKNSSGQGDFEPGQRASQIYWVLDGVVVECGDLPFKPRGCSCALVASAQDMSLDVSGFRLIQDQNYQQRLQSLLEAANPFVQACEFDFEQLLAGQKAHEQQVRLGVGAVCLGLLWLAPPFGMMAMALSAAGLLLGSQGSAMVAAWQKELKELKAGWARKLGSDL